MIRAYVYLVLEIVIEDTGHLYKYYMWKWYFMIVTPAKGKICIVYIISSWEKNHYILWPSRNNTDDKNESIKQTDSNDPDYFNYGYAEPGEGLIFKKMKLGIKSSKGFARDGLWTP